jgi:hypothetical protein
LQQLLQCISVFVVSETRSQQNEAADYDYEGTSSGSKKRPKKRTVDNDDDEETSVLRKCRPKNPENDSYPMNDAEFQRRVLLTLSHMNHKISSLDRKYLKMAEHFVGNNVNQREINQAKTKEDLLIMEENVSTSEVEKRKLQSAFDGLGLSADDVRDHVYAILDFIMNLEVQVLVNMIYGNNVPNKQYTDRISMTDKLPTVLSCILVSVGTKWQQTSEKKVKSILSDRLRQAKKRLMAKQNRTD